MSSLVEELQRDCLDSNIDISNLLRKAFVIAKKLKTKDFEKWIQLELKGYKDHEELPGYRNVSGQLKGYDQFRGWQPIFIVNKKMEELFESYPIHDSITQISNLIEKSEKRKENIHLILKESVQLDLMKSIGKQAEINYVVDSLQFKKIIEEVKDHILNWVLELEEKGIKGEGMSFTQKEKEAVEGTSFIYNIYGAQGNIQFQNNTQNSNQTMISDSNVDFNKVRELVKLIETNHKNIKASKEKKEKILNKTNEIKEELNNSSPNKHIVKEGLKTIRSIAEGITGSLIASGIVNYINCII